MEHSFAISENLYTAMHKCTRCGQCAYGNQNAGFSSLCPMQIKGKFFSFSAGGMMQLARSLYEGKAPFSESVRNILYLCTTCGACEINCGVIEGQVDLFTLVKKELVNKGVPLLEAHRMVVDNTVDKKAPYGGRLPERCEWLPREKRQKPASKPEVFYYVGCVSSYRETDIPNAFVNILSKLGIPFAIDDQEWCCGAPLYFAGHEKEAREFAIHNVEVIEKSGAHAAVFTCPTCALMFKKYYPEWIKREPQFEVLHSTEYLDRLSEQGRLKLNVSLDSEVVTYHDPCHLGRGQGIYDAPRKILQSIKGVRYKEANRNRENSFCCGGGGLLPTGFPTIADELALERALEMKNTGAHVFISACPACKENLKIAAKKVKGRTRVFDLTELVSEALGS